MGKPSKGRGQPNIVVSGPPSYVPPPGNRMVGWILDGLGLTLFGAAILGFEDGRSGLYIFGNLIGGLLMGGLGVRWKHVSPRLPRRFVETAAQCVSDFRVWVGVVLLALAADVAIAYLNNLPASPMTPFTYMIEYGSDGIGHYAALRMSADGNAIIRFAGHNIESRYNVAAGIIRYFQTQDAEDVVFDMKSDIRKVVPQPIRWRLPLSDQYRKENAQGVNGTAYILFLVPKGVSVSQYNTIAEVKAVGGLVLQASEGPP